MDSRNIKPINRNSVHKICSGQVVLTLATAVKELVENSIDAGATIIEVKLKEYGSEQIEVTDNGKGVKASDFQSITLKHHTSKISDFSDVSSVSTFGFRGEALSSLCALSNVEIITCHSTSNVGTLLIYDHDGVLVKNSPTHRQVGTTVILKNLFFTLPVRHKEFLRNIRREYAKMLQLLTAYCLISINKRITCTNITDKGRKTIVLSTSSCDTLKDNITCIFGSKQINSLMEFVQQCPSESNLEEYFLPKTDIEKCEMFRIEGYISSSIHGEGRSTTDRQFFFLNGRPCDLPKVSKLMNEIYHSFNKAQYPFVFLNIILTEGSADVNVTPDKRQIFIPEEKLLLCIIKTSLSEMYELQPSQMKVSQSSLSFQCKSPEDGSPVPQPLKLSEGSDEFSLKRKLDLCTSNSDQDFPAPSLKSIRKDDSIVEGGSKEVTTNYANDVQCSSNSGFPSPDAVTAKPFDGALAAEMEKRSPIKIKSAKYSSARNVNFTLTLPFNEEKAFKNASHGKSGNLSLKEILQKAYRGKGNLGNPACTKSDKSNKSNKQKATSDQNNLTAFMKVNKEIEDIELDTSVESSSDLNSVNSSPPNHSSTSQISNSLGTEFLTSEGVQIDEHQSRKKRSRTIGFSIEAIKKDIEAKRKNLCDGDLGYRKFRSKINPAENISAEEELKKEIKKENFSYMDIIGQFNLGFIITRLNDDLFIVDQHATDEKYNFETLQKETVLETQKLLNPQNLNFTAVSEAVLLDNLHVFEKSGFKFNIDESNSVGKKIQLISVPVSHNWSFGKEDVDEMIFMLTDNPVSVVRPSRVNQMFASKACRKSVMIGTALTVPMMKKLIVHMGEIEQPWNCPHGRPTMRHLFSLNLLKTVR